MKSKRTKREKKEETMKEKTSFISFTDKCDDQSDDVQIAVFRNCFFFLKQYDHFPIIPPFIISLKRKVLFVTEKSKIRRKISLPIKEACILSQTWEINIEKRKRKTRIKGGRSG